MRSGRLRHRVRFERLVRSTDRDPSTGYPVGGEDNWQVVALADGLELDCVPAEVLTGPGRKPYIAETDWGVVTARINCRWFSADMVDMYKWRIVWLMDIGQEVIYNIYSIETDATARAEWRFKCTGGLNHG